MVLENDTEHVKGQGFEDLWFAKGDFEFYLNGEHVAFHLGSRVSGI